MCNLGVRKRYGTSSAHVGEEARGAGEASELSSCGQQEAEGQASGVC